MFFELEVWDEELGKVTVAGADPAPPATHAHLSGLAAEVLAAARRADPAGIDGPGVLIDRGSAWAYARAWHDRTEITRHEMGNGRTTTWYTSDAPATVVARLAERNGTTPAELPDERGTYIPGAPGPYCDGPGFTVRICTGREFYEQSQAERDPTPLPALPREEVP